MTQKLGLTTAITSLSFLVAPATAMAQSQTQTDATVPASKAPGADMPALPSPAPAQPGSKVNKSAKPSAPGSFKPITFKTRSGAKLTLYGTIDVDVTYQTHGAKTDADYPPGASYLILGAKNAKASGVRLAQNGTAGTKVGAAASVPIVGEWTGLAQAEIQFSPLSGGLVDGLKSMVKQNGIPLAEQQYAWGDSNKAGQLLGGLAIVGVSNPVYGFLSFGRHTGLVWDDLARFDPNRGAVAFSLVGYSGSIAGAGASEARYMNNTVRYKVKHGPLTLGLLYGPGYSGARGRALQANVGFERGPLALAASYSSIHDGIAASPLTTNATGTLSAAQKAALAQAGFSETNSLSATVSDVNTWMVNASYRIQKVTLLTGYEHIRYSNPASPLTEHGIVSGLGAIVGLGGYDMLTNSSAYPRDRTLQIMWAGARYAATRRLEIDMGAYLELQNNYSTDKALAGCSSSVVSSQCSGHMIALSGVAVYKAVKHIDLYGGVTWSKIGGGMANGYLSTDNLEPTAGVRISF